MKLVKYSWVMSVLLLTGCPSQYGPNWLKHHDEAYITSVNGDPLIIPPNLSLSKKRETFDIVKQDTDNQTPPNVSLLPPESLVLKEESKPHLSFWDKITGAHA